MAWTSPDVSDGASYGLSPAKFSACSKPQFLGALHWAQPMEVTLLVEVKDPVPQQKY